MSKEQSEALPLRLAKRLCDGISTGHDWPNTDDELLRMQSAAELRRLHAENDALRAQIGQGEPDVDDLRCRLVAISSAIADSDDIEAQAIIRTTLEMLASAPPAPQQKPVAYLDIGAVGYIDLGTDLSTEQLQALPAGRHMLGIIGTFGADGYVPAPQQKPLTDEQINKMWSDAHNDTSTMSLIHVLVRAVEAAHNIGEKK